MKWNQNICSGFEKNHKSSPPDPNKNNQLKQMEGILNINTIYVIHSIMSPLQKQTWVASVYKEVQERIVSVWWPFDVRSRCDRPFSRFAITWNQMLPTWKIRNLRRRKSGQLWPHKWCLWVRRNYSHIMALNCIWTTGCYADKNVLVLTTLQLKEKANLNTISAK